MCFCLFWLLVFFVFLGLLKISTKFLFHSNPYFQLKTLKTRFYYFYFLVVFCFYFYWKYFQIFNQTHFYHHFLFSVKIKTENNKTKHHLKFLNSWILRKRHGRCVLLMWEELVWSIWSCWLFTLIVIIWCISIKIKMFDCFHMWW